jgi:hypothetical protein
MSCRSHDCRFSININTGRQVRPTRLAAKASIASKLAYSQAGSFQDRRWAWSPSPTGEVRGAGLCAQTCRRLMEVQRIGVLDRRGDKDEANLEPWRKLQLVTKRAKSIRSREIMRRDRERKRTCDDLVLTRDGLQWKVPLSIDCFFGSANMKRLIVRAKKP